MRFPSWLLILVLALVQAAVCGCSRSSTASPVNAAPQQPGATAVPAVSAVKPERKTIQRIIGQPGQIEAFQQTPVFAKIAGFVQEVRVDIGDTVESGQVLAVLTVPEMDEELAQKEATIGQARAELERARRAHEASQARVQIADALFERWKAEHDRLEKLSKDGKGVIDRQTLDETRYQWDAAKAGRAEAEALRDKAQAEVRVAQARLEVTQADRRRMAALLDYAEVKAPFDGVVTRRNVDKGHFVQPATSGGTRADPLFVVVQTDPVRVFVDVPETDAVWISDGMPARVRVQALPGRDFDGKVTRSAWALDPRARTLRTEIDIDNPKGELRPGMYAYATIHVEHAKTWTLPAAAVVTQNELTICYRVENGKAVRTPVEVGLREGAFVEVLKKQMKPTKRGEKPVWEEFTDREEFVHGNAVPLTDGQAISVTPGTK